MRRKNGEEESSLLSETKGMDIRDDGVDRFSFKNETLWVLCIQTQATNSNLGKVLLARIGPKWIRIRLKWSGSKHGI